MKIYPVDGRIVHDPVTKRVVPAKGMVVTDEDSFWLRRLEDGDVTQTPPSSLEKEVIDV